VYKKCFLQKEKEKKESIISRHAAQGILMSCKFIKYIHACGSWIQIKRA
jgi:hypothetical protein